MTYEDVQPYTGGGGIEKVAGRIRAAQHRLQNGDGWFSWRGVSDLAGMGYIIHGRAEEVWARFDAYQRARRTVVRVLGMLGSKPWVDAGLAFAPSSPGYFDARAEIVAQANRRGLYVEFGLFADAQIVMPSNNARWSTTVEFADFCRDEPGVIPQLANEAAFNGWSEADDPALLELADIFASNIGHHDFSISDPVDGDNPDASAATTARFKTLAQHSNILVLHPSRASSSEWRRWVNHLEGMTDVISELPGYIAYVPDEPMGAALTTQPGRRDADPDAHVAAQFVALCCGFAGYTYHKIDSEIPVEKLPGFYDIADLLARVPVSPDWRYANDSWPGSPTEGITWVGAPGKMRSLVNGQQAWTVAHGEADWNSVRWRAGYTPTLVYDGPCCHVWTVNQ